MTDYHDVRDALCKMRDQPDGSLGVNGKRLLTDWEAFSLAPHVVRALRAAYAKGCETRYDDDEGYPHDGVAAGVAALLAPTEGKNGPTC